MADTKLKPCPFCGGEAVFFNFVDRDPRSVTATPVCQILCTNCKALMGNFVAEDSSFSYKDKATEAWNRRANDG